MLARTHRAALLLAGLLSALVLGGCAGYGAFPRTDGARAIDDPSTPWMRQAMVTAITHVERLYPAPGSEPFTPNSDPSVARFAVNLPEGMPAGAYGSIVSNVGRGAVALSSDMTGLPVYHMAQIRVRGDGAEVDIVRPVFEDPAPLLGGVDRDGLYQGVTVTMRGGVRLAWRVTAVRSWRIGVIGVPEPNPIDLIDAEDDATNNAEDDTDTDTDAGTPEDAGAGEG